jgi:FMN phosphatase YigB (HAD superfamily)
LVAVILSEAEGLSMTFRSMAIRALLFDLWGTLIEDSRRQEEPRSQTRARLVAQALDAAGHPCPHDEVALALQAFNKEHSALHAQGLDIAPPERLERFLRVLAPGLAERLAPNGQRAVEDALVAAIRLHPPLPAPGSHETLLEAQRRGLGLGLVSNTGISPGYALRELLADFGLLHYLQALTFSDEICLVKPAPELFRCTLEVLGVAPSDAVFIGDLPHTDMAGALGVGMWAVQIGDQQADGVEPHARIESLTELFPALERLGLLKS